MNLLVNIGLWFVFWWLVFGYFNFYLKKHGVGFKDNFITTCLYFLFSTFVIFIIFNYELGLLFTRIKLVGPLVLVIFFNLQFLTFKYLKDKGEQIVLEGTELFPIDYRFFVSKSFEIGFQTLMEAVLVALLFVNGVGPGKGIVLFSFIFGMAHLPLLLVTVGSQTVKLIVTSSFIFSGFLAYLVLRWNYGFILLYITHWLFYLSFAFLVVQFSWIRDFLSNE